MYVCLCVGVLGWVCKCCCCYRKVPCASTLCGRWALYKFPLLLLLLSCPRPAFCRQAMVLSETVAIFCPLLCIPPEPSFCHPLTESAVAGPTKTSLPTQRPSLLSSASLPGLLDVTLKVAPPPPRRLLLQHMLKLTH